MLIYLVFTTSSVDRDSVYLSSQRLGNMLQAMEIIGSTSEALVYHHSHPDEWAEDDYSFPASPLIGNPLHCESSGQVTPIILLV